jgi:hypothetical protein
MARARVLKDSRDASSISISDVPTMCRHLFHSRKKECHHIMELGLQLMTYLVVFEGQAYILTSTYVTIA